MASSNAFSDLLSVIAINAPDFELEHDLDLGSAFEQLREALADVPAAKEPATRRAALETIERAYEAFEAGDLGAGGRLLQAVHSDLFSPDRPARSIGSYGGPRVMVAHDARERWLGYQEESDNDHYGAACSADEVGVVAPFGEPVLVLGCAPVGLFAKQLEDGAVVWGWEFGETEDEMEKLAMEVAASRRFDSVVAFPCEGGRYRIFDGVVAGDAVEEHLALELGPGEWRVGYAYVERGDMGVSVYGIHRPA